MSLDTYANLQTAIAARLRRSDRTVYAPDFITLAEARMNRSLRCQRMVSRGTISITDQLAAVPADFVAPISMRLTSESNSPVVRWVSNSVMDDLLSTQEQASGIPQHYTLEGGDFRLSPDPGSGPYTAELSYYAKVPALSNSNTSNWVLATHPDLYFNGALAEAYLDVRQPDMADPYLARFNEIVAEINASDSGLGTLEVLPGVYGAGYI